MADDKHFVPGDYYRISDRSGRKIRAGKTRKEWTNSIVGEKEWEPRHPQDFVRGVKDDQNVPEPRPRPTDTFIGPLGTTLSADAAARATVLQVTSSIRMVAGDTITVMLDDGTAPRTQISVVNSATQITIVPGLSSKASSGNEVIDYTAYSQPDIG